MKLLKRIRRLFCRHECRVVDMHRVSPEEVVCVCLKCGKTLHAPYGFALKARLVR